MIIGIVAAGKNWEIGKNNGLLFKLKKDMEMFKNLTTFNIVAMGENTLLSFPKSKPLKNRVNLVLCKKDTNYEGCICFHTFDEMLNAIKLLSSQYDVYIIGGAMFYRSMYKYCVKIYVTKVDAEDAEATVFFPDLDKDFNFKIVKESDTIYDNGYNIKFVTYENINKN